MSDAFEPGYTEIVELGRPGQLAAAVGRRPGVLRVELSGDRALHFDDEGRLISAHLEGVSHRRTLDNRLLLRRILRRHPELSHGRTGWRDVEPPADPLGFLDELHAHARKLLRRLEGGAEARSIGEQELSDAAAWARRMLEPAAHWDRAALRQDTENLRAIYRPIPILPPDQYGALLFQATEGCSFNRCGFCSFYDGVSYRERGREEFGAHVDAVLAHLGRSAESKHRAFLGQANAFNVDTVRVVEYLHELGRRIPLQPDGLTAAARVRWRQSHPLWIDGVYAFVDGFHRLKSVEELRQLRAVGMRRVYLGLESGSDEVLRVLDKPGGAGPAVELARRLSEADIALGVILLVGAGGRGLASLHESESIDALRRMELGSRDQLYLSRLVVQQGSSYAERAHARGLGALDAGEQSAQIQRLRTAIHALPGRRIPVAPYDMSMSRAAVLSDRDGRP